MEKIAFQDGDGSTVEFYVLEQTRIGGTDYILVTEEAEGDGDALILKDVSAPEDPEAEYEIVSEDPELSTVAEMFMKMDDELELTEDPSEE
ncbi:MAG: DUF1292 domain-containing protein [Lachnospiraceae bacterium]|nr:DUF1292 domain-containing protein [Lachnospiraceae bacterium]